MGFPGVFLLLAGTVVNASLRPRAPSPPPVAISIPPSQRWTGNDGSWSSFALRVGTPEQDVDVLISTGSSETWVIVPEGCTPNDPPDCPACRGHLFNSTASSTWQPQSIYPSGLLSNLGYSADGIYGLDTVGIGSQDSGALTKQVVAGVSTKDFYLGLFGISPNPINFSDPNAIKPNFLTGLKQNGTVPSLSWGYTAGAQYRTFPASLTLGGYDISRFVPNNLTFPFNDDIPRDLTVGLQSITLSSYDKPDKPLLPTPIYAAIDSTIPHLWLPMNACVEFESAFGLTWNDQSNLYLVNQTLHESLLARNASVKFKLGVTPRDGQSVDIVLPYAAFDLEASYPLVRHPARYFPLKRAANDSQYTLGRAFLQEAYLTVDYERLNFSVSQCIFNSPSDQNLITIIPFNNSTNISFTPSSSSHLSMGALVGIAIGAIGIIGMLVFYFCVHRTHQYGEHLEGTLSNTNIGQGGNQGQKTEPSASSAMYQMNTERDSRESYDDSREAGVGPAGRRLVYEMAVVNPTSAGGSRAQLGRVREEEEEDSANNFI